MKNILVTGGAGFIGSNFIIYLLEKYKDVRVVNIDLLTYASNKSLLKNFSNDERYNFEKGDIQDSDFVDYVFVKYKVDNVIHFAAESHVDNSIINPSIFVNSWIKISLLSIYSWYTSSK